MSVFISYSHIDKKFVDRLCDDLKESGLSIWIDQQLQAGTSDWEMEVRAAIEGAESVVYIATESACQSRYCKDELALARISGRKIYPVFAQGNAFYKCIPLGMGHIEYIDMRGEEYDIGLPRLLKTLGIEQAENVKAIPAAEPERVPLPPDFEPTNPYKGLQAFTAEDRSYFFGRSTLMQLLMDKIEGLTEERFLAIVGPSGAGKSSVVMAGLLPTIQDRHSDWLFLPRVEPGDRPLEALAIMFQEHFQGGAISDYERDLRESNARALVMYTRRLTSNSTQRVVLFIDQFEELFSQMPPEREPERRQFIDLIITAALDPKSNVVVILTLRADFTGYALAYSELERLLQDHTQFVPPLSKADLREVIEEPARQQHLTFDPDLAAELLYAVFDQAGALPLLQFTLDQLFQRRNGLQLTHVAYEEIGGLQGAIAKHADQIYLDLPDDLYRELARGLFLRLLEIGSKEQEPTRRRATRRELIPENREDLPRLNTVIDTFITAGLLTTSENETIEVAHEALLREWPTLVRWINGALTDLPTQNALRTAVTDWMRTGDPNYLASPGRLRDFQDWATRNHPTADEQGYIQASQARQVELERREALREKKLRELTNRAKAAGVIGVIAIILVAFAIISVITAQDRVSSADATLTPVAQQVQDSKNLSNSLQMAAYANTVLQDDKADKLPAILLSIRALKSAYSVQADTVLVKALESNYAKKGFIGHTGGVTSVTFSPDGHSILTGSDDGTARLWDIGSEQTIHIFEDHMGRVTSVAFSPDGRSILTGSDDGTARLWDVASGQIVLILSVHTSKVNSVTFSLDGRSILTGSDDGTARLWDVASGQTIRTLRGHTGGVTSVAFSSDGLSILTGSDDSTARLWDVASGQTARILSGHTSKVNSVAFSPDGKLALTGGGDHTARLWDVGSGELVHILSGHAGRVWSVTFSPDGRSVLTGSGDDTARLWNVASGQTLQILNGHTNVVRYTAFSPDGRSLLTGSSDGTARLWGITSSQTVRTLHGHAGGVTSVTFSPDGRSILTGSDDGTARLWDVASGQTLRVLSGHTSNVNGVAFSPDGRSILTGSDDGTARLWDVASGQTLHVLSGHTDRVWSVAFSSDGKLALTGSDDGTARLWGVASGHTVHILSGHTGGVWSVAFSPDNQFILTGSFDGTARLWNVISKQSAPSLSGGSVTSVAFSPDGKLALTGSFDGTARLWNVANDLTIHTLRGYTGRVTSVAFSPDGRSILTGSDDGTARLWDVASGQTIRVLSGHTASVTSVAFSPDGRLVLTGSDDGTAQLWDVDYQNFVVYACTQIWRDFTPSERQQFGILDNEPTCPQFAKMLVGYTNSGSETLTPVFNGPLTTAMPLLTTPLPVTLPVFTPIASATLAPTYTPTESATLTATATYPGVLITFTLSAKSE